MSLTSLVPFSKPFRLSSIPCKAGTRRACTTQRRERLLSYSLFLTISTARWIYPGCSWALTRNFHQPVCYKPNTSVFSVTGNCRVTLSLVGFLPFRLELRGISIAFVLLLRLWHLQPTFPSWTSLLFCTSSHYQHTAHHLSQAAYKYTAQQEILALILLNSSLACSTAELFPFY